MNDKNLQLERLQRALGHVFRDPALLELALSHRSVGARNNERLEFLGDSILNHVIAEQLYNKFPVTREGDLSRMRASLVCGETLAELGRELKLGDHLLLGSGERKSGGRRRGSILADTVEALFGAVLLDDGIESCRACVLRLFEPRLALLSLDSATKDPKTRLQEYLQGRARPLPAYELISVSGEDHAQQFQVACRLTRPALAVEGGGSSRRRAEQDAAERALEQLGVNS